MPDHDVHQDNDAYGELERAQRAGSTSTSSCATLLQQYPRATVAVMERAGHALMHEQPELRGALIGDWLGRTPELDVEQLRLQHADHRPK